jgi:chromosome segregation ATPase
MSKDNDNNERASDITDQPTGEYPVLHEIAEAYESATVAPHNGTVTPTPQTEAPAKAAFWLTHLEAEVTRMHAKWQSIETEFHNRETRISRLHEEVQVRESTIANLTAELLRGASALEDANERLVRKDAEIAALVADRRTRDERIAALSTELADGEVVRKETLERIARKEAEMAGVNDAVERERAALATIEERNRQLLIEHDVLQAKLQDLETYVDGRRDRWFQQDAKLADYESTLISAEKTINARNAVIARHDEEEQKLVRRVHELERQCAEFDSRRKDSEGAYDELQKILAVHVEQSEQLKNEYTRRAKDSEHAVKRALESQQHIDSLERDLKRRDEVIDALKADAEQSKLAAAELATAKGALAEQIGELEKGLTEGLRQTQVLRDELRASQDQLRRAQEQLAERTAQLTSREQAFDQELQVVERLNSELRASEKEHERTRAERDALEAHTLELGKVRGEELAESEHLKRALAAQQALAVQLETELRAKQATADLLERSVERLSDLGASLAALDQQMNDSVTGGKRAAEPPVLPLSDYAATVADDRLSAAAPPPTTHAGVDADADADEVDSIPVLGLEEEAHVVDVGEPTAGETGRKLVITIGGEAFHYPLRKERMTIGRGHGSDIRIASHFVSRVHAKIATNGSATVIEDAGSKNGVLVNSERVLRRVLHDGDVINLGYDLNLRFVDAAP